MDMAELEAEPGGGGGVRLWVRASSGDWKLALELRFVRPSLFLKRALKELMNDKPVGAGSFLKRRKKGRPGTRRLTRVSQDGEGGGPKEAGPKSVCGAVRCGAA